MRQRLPPRRDVEITTLHLRRTDGSEVQFEAAVGFDPQSGEPREVFLNGAKAGSDMAFVLADTAVAISVALQSGVRARAMVQSIARVPTELDGPPTAPASVIGAVLELLASYEKETEDDL